jgi:tetratricopeptide (TPR) repeat protein
MSLRIVAGYGSKLHALTSVNEPPREHIPGRRRRLVVLLSLAGVIGIAAAAAVAMSARDEGSQPAVAAAACRALSGRPPLALDLPGAALPAEDQQNDDAVLRAAEGRLPAGDVRISVGRLVNDYATAGAAATLRGLRGLDQSQPVVQLHEGLVQLWAGDCTAAERTLQRLRTADLYGYYGTVADNTLHTDQRPGLPIYIPPDGTPHGSVEQLRARVRAHPDDGPAWLGLASVEEAAGNRRAALAAAKQARAVDPTAVSPRVAVAVIGYDKNDPTASFAVLGPLTAQASDPTEVLFHLGLLLYWREQNTDAVAQWRQVVSESPGSIYGKIAAQLMRQIS